MERTKKPGVVFYATQPGATFETFDKKRCLTEVVYPARELIESGLVESILFLIICDPDAPCSEEFRKEPLDQEPPPKPVTPTSAFLVEAMRHERSERLFDYLNLHVWGKFPESILSYATAFVQGQSTVRGVIVCPEGAPFPSPAEVAEVMNQLENDTVVTLVPAAVAL